MERRIRWRRRGPAPARRWAGVVVWSLPACLRPSSRSIWAEKVPNAPASPRHHGGAGGGDVAGIVRSDRQAGACHGIQPGHRLCLAQGLAAAGAAVVLNGRTRPSSSARSPSFGRGPQVAGHAFDVTDPEAVEAAVAPHRSQRAARHPGQQCRHPAAHAAGRVSGRDLARADADQPRCRVLCRPGGREAHDRAQARQDHQHRVPA